MYICLPFILNTTNQSSHLFIVRNTSILGVRGVEAVLFWGAAFVRKRTSFAMAVNSGDAQLTVHRKMLVSTEVTSLLRITFFALFCGATESFSGLT